MPFPRFLRWAVANLFPVTADPWSAAATKVEPPYSFYTPGVPAGTQEDNYILNAIAEVANLNATLPLNQMTAPQAANTITSGTALDVLAYDEGGGLWFGAGHSSDSLTASADNGASWVSIATPSDQVNAIGFFSPTGVGSSSSFTPSDGVLILGGSSNVFFYANTGALIDSTSTQGITFNGGAVAFGLPTSTAAVFGFSWDSTNHRTRAFSCTGSGAGAYTLMTLPTAWQTGPQTNIHYFTYAVGPALDALVAWGGATPGSDTSYILHMNAASFPTTPTFTALTLPGGMSGNAVTGVAYNATTEQWGAMVYDGTHSALWATADLTTWTQQTNITGQCGGLVTCGPYWVTTAKRGGLPGTNNYSPIYSFDGVTWYRGGSTITTAVAKLAMGRGCIAGWDTNFGAISLVRIG